MRRFRFWVRWSARELRRRWVQVAAIALVIAIGTGVFAGLGSTSAWRQRSYDDSYAALHMHDLRVELRDGSFVRAGSLEAALASMSEPGWIAGTEERLLLQIQVDASTDGQTVLVPGRAVGVDVSGGGPRIDGIHVTGGRGLRPDDDGRPLAVLEAHFADRYGLPPTGRIRLSGAVPVSYVGTGYTPEYFMVTDGSAGFSLMAEATFAVVVMPLASTQSIGGHPGQVNDLVIRLAPGVDVERARAAVLAAVSRALPDIGASVSTRAEDPAYRLLYGDLASDQGTLNTLAFLMFLAAVFASFNLTSRIVDAGRREIGIGMALGVPRRTIAIRPLLVGAEIALLGVAFGVGVGIAFGNLMRGVLSGMLPLPVWETPFMPEKFAAAAALGFALPLLATAWPVWRAVRVSPVDAIRPLHLTARGGGLAPLVKRLRLPGGTFAQMPVRNVLRAPRRTVLTAVGIGAALMAMVAVIGMLDSWAATMDRGRAETLAVAPDRLTANLTGFVPVDGPMVEALGRSPAVGAVDPIITSAGALMNGGRRVDVLIELADPATAIWMPTLTSRAPAGDLPGIVIANKAATDLGVRAGDVIRVEHLVRRGAYAFASATTPMRVNGIHPNPIRAFAYMDLRDADVMGLAGTTNAVRVRPAAGYTVDDVERALFGLPGVTSVQPADASAHAMDDLIASFSDIFTIVEFFALLMAFLVAFNAVNINVDERAREHATMFAFGTRLRTLLCVTGEESLIVSLLGAALGIALGAVALGLLLRNATSETPDLEIVPTLGIATIATAIAFGVIAALIATVLAARKLRRMDVASTLRVME